MDIGLRFSIAFQLYTQNVYLFVDEVCSKDNIFLLFVQEEENWL